MYQLLLPHMPEILALNTALCPLADSAPAGNHFPPMPFSSAVNGLIYRYASLADVLHELDLPVRDWMCLHCVSAGVEHP